MLKVHVVTHHIDGFEIKVLGVFKIKEDAHAFATQWFNENANDGLSGIGVEEFELR